MDPCFRWNASGIIFRALLFSSQMNSDLLPLGWTFSDLHLRFAMHFCRHLNSSTTTALLMSCPTKAWSEIKKQTDWRNTSLWKQTENTSWQRKQKNKKFPVKMIAGKKLIDLLFCICLTHPHEFQKGFRKSLCSPSQIELTERSQPQSWTDLATD